MDPERKQAARSSERRRGQIRVEYLPKMKDLVRRILNAVVVGMGVQLE